MVYSEVDQNPACFSPYWLKDILREELKFNGCVFSDDLSMEGAKSMGDVTSRSKQALSAGCDMLLCCNDRESVIEIIDNLPQKKNALSQARIHNMLGKKLTTNFDELRSTSTWFDARQMLDSLNK